MLRRIFTEENLKRLNLTDEQRLAYIDLEKRWCTLYNALQGVNLPLGAINGIMAHSDLNKLDMGNIEALKEGIRNEYKDIIL